MHTAMLSVQSDDDCILFASNGFNFVSYQLDRTHWTYPWLVWNPFVDKDLQCICRRERTIRQWHTEHDFSALILVFVTVLSIVDEKDDIPLSFPRPPLSLLSRLVFNQMLTSVQLVITIHIPSLCCVFSPRFILANAASFVAMTQLTFGILCESERVPLRSAVTFKWWRHLCRLIQIVMDGTVSTGGVYIGLPSGEFLLWCSKQTVPLPM
jgi:hypothetical protein